MQLNLKSDVIFKIFFGKKGNEEFLIDFLNALLKIEIKTIKIEQEVDLGKLSIKEKTGRLDLQATLNDGIIVNIEMQVRNEYNIMARTTFYAGKQITKITRKGEKYENIKKIIMVNILDYEIFSFDEYVAKTITVLEEHRECEVINDVKWYFIELPKFRRQKPDMNDKLNQWIAFIDNYDKEKVVMAVSKNEVLKKAQKEMEYLTGDAEAERLEFLKDKWERDYNSGIYYVKLKIAREMLENNIDMELIMKCTGLKKEEILKLKTNEHI